MGSAHKNSSESKQFQELECNSSSEVKRNEKIFGQKMVELQRLTRMYYLFFKDHKEGQIFIFNKWFLEDTLINMIFFTLEFLPNEILVYKFQFSSENDYYL